MTPSARTDAPPGPRQRIVVAMSGGVDSSVTAALLHEQGHEVIGVTLQLSGWSDATGGTGASDATGRTCCAARDILDARRVAEAIGIPHYVLDYAGRFRDEVIQPFADSYARGETPIPCVLCNQTVKFRDLLAAARTLGASALATGHYVRRVDGPGGPELHRAVDPRRDQSYFLFATTRAQLGVLSFPLGGMRGKDDTRDHARRLGLPVADKRDSQDICFVPDGDHAGLVSRLRPDAAEPGDIVHVDGRVLGRHPGIIHFTIGQRRGIGIGGRETLFVVRLDAANRRVVVGPREALARTRVRVRDLNWLGPGLAPPEDGVAATVKLRSLAPPVAAVVCPDGQGGAVVSLEQPVWGVAPGQACVMYAGERVLGGGWIAGDPAA